MSHYRYGGSDRRGYGDDYKDRRYGGGRDRYDDHRDRYGGSGKGRDRQERRPEKGGRRGGQDDRRDRRPRGGDRGQPVKRRAENSAGSGPDGKKLKPGNNWHGEDRHALMHALPMESKPENFETEWVFVVRPPGRRRTVVAANNITQSYNNAYDPDMKFETCLPSGNVKKDAMFKQQDLTILDTVYSPEKKKFYVVDMVHWRHYPYYETEAEFRFFCLEDKWLQLENPGEKWSLNDYPLHLLHKYPCTSENILEALKDFDEKVDDILFIKKDSVYSPTDSPDCLKLRLDKLPDILGIAVPEGVDFSLSSTKSKEEQKSEYKDSKDGKSASEKKREDVGSKGDKSKNSVDGKQAAAHKDGAKEESQDDDGIDEGDD